jgi:Galactose oxidase, central domain
MVGVLLQGGRVLVTGTSSDGLRVGNVDIYDPAKGWSPGPKLSSDLSGAVAAPLSGGGALLAGGVPYFGATDSPNLMPLATAMTYNPATRTWTKVPNMSVARTNATATALPDGRVLVAGGYNGRLIQLTNPPRQGIQILPLTSSQLFNPTSSTWTTGPALAHSRFGHSAVALKGGRVLVVGGADRQDPVRLLNSAELFDPAAGRWLSAGSIGAPRTQFTLTALADGRALLAGGLAADGSTVLSSTQLYDPAKNLWSSGPGLANARTAHAAAALADGRVLVTGGADLVGRLASSELLDTPANSWSATGALATPRSNHLALSLPNGRILAIGGSGSSDPLTSSELFDPAAKGTPAAPRLPAGPGRWQLAAAKPIPVPDDTNPHPAQLLPDGRVLVMPARAYGDFDAQVYDPKLDAWTTPFRRKAPPCNNCGIGSPTPPVFIAAPLSNNKLLLLTVDPQKIIAAKAEVIDLKTGKATPAASPGKIGYVRLDLLPDGRIWRTAMQEGDRHAFLYNPAANRWTATSDVPLGLVQSGGDMQTVTAVPGGRVVVAGALKAMVYSPASGHWADAGSFPNAGGGSLALGLPSWTGFSATGLTSGDVLLAGGSVLQGTTPGGAPIYATTTQVMRWDHSTGLLAPAESMPVANSNHSGALLADGRVLLAGGVDAVGVNTGADPVARAEIYDPAARSWAPAAPLPAARSGAVAVTLKDGRVLLVGGYGMSLGSSAQGGRLPSLLFTPQS